MFAARWVGRRRHKRADVLDSEMLDRVRAILPEALSDYSEYLAATQDSSGAGLPIWERMLAVLPRKGNAEALRATIESEVRIRNLEKRLGDEYVTKSELYLTAFIATSVAITCISGVWLVVEQLVGDEGQPSRVVGPYVTTTTEPD